MVKYYYQAQSEPETWYVNLYKVMDTLKKKYRTKKPSKLLSLDDKDWEFFEKTLNTHDLRHADSLRSNRESISLTDEKRAFRIAHGFVQAYIDKTR